VDPSVYRSRWPAETPLYALLESLFETVKGAWEDLFERRYGFWRGILDGVVARYLDCGIFERGFARIRCPDCATEFLLAFSCKGRGLCLREPLREIISSWNRGSPVAELKNPLALCVTFLSRLPPDIRTPKSC
jgi:Transposase zinc-binding domain